MFHIALDFVFPLIKQKMYTLSITVFLHASIYHISAVQHLFPFCVLLQWCGLKLWTWCF